MKKVSIVTAYYNRRKLFYNTLKTIEKSKYKNDIEIIVVDDASIDEHRIDDFPELFDLDINVIRIDKSEKWWHNPCIPFNIGFKHVNSDIVIIQNPECLHYGDIIEFTINNIDNNKYLNFACYSVDNFLTEKISNINFDNPNINNFIGKLIYPLNNKPASIDGMTSWYNHSIYRPHKLHFCSSITKNDLDDLKGFDEQYAKGIAYDDNDFLLRITRKKMDIKIIDNPYVIHQFHGNTQYGQLQHLVQKNFAIYQNVLKNNI